MIEPFFPSPWHHSSGRMYLMIHTDWQIWDTNYEKTSKPDNDEYAELFAHEVNGKTTYLSLYTFNRDSRDGVISPGDEAVDRTCSLLRFTFANFVGVATRRNADFPPGLVTDEAKC